MGMLGTYIVIEHLFEPKEVPELRRFINSATRILGIVVMSLLALMNGVAVSLFYPNYASLPLKVMAFVILNLVAIVSEVAYATHPSTFSGLRKLFLGSTVILPWLYLILLAFRLI
jgi:hypothetical protein